MDVSVGDQLEIILRLLLAGLLGGLVGLERDLRDYPAGLRTMALVTLGAALFMEVSRITGDEDRIAAQVVTG
ncbi:MAG TPA: MgtC/SapB family protein, partial [Dehalococcoidia bacterium]|nr:MgtC/SapB family protein [Dehalococcoidia bacterium]